MAIDPLTAATTFSTIVSLISDFRDKHKEVAADDHQKFLEWLSENRHYEIKELLEQNQATVISIKAILNQQSSEVLEKLKSIDTKLGDILSADTLFGPLVRAVAPFNGLSEQCINILRQFEDAQASEIVERNLIGYSGYLFMDGSGVELKYNQPRFIEDDFLMLVQLGLLRLDYASGGSKRYKITRAASKLVQSI